MAQDKFKPEFLSSILASHQIKQTDRQWVKHVVTVGVEQLRKDMGKMVDGYASKIIPKSCVRKISLSLREGN